MIGSVFDDLRGASRALGLTKRRVLGFTKRPKLKAIRRLVWKGLDIPRRERFFAAQTQRVSLRQAIRGRKIQREQIDKLQHALAQSGEALSKSERRLRHAHVGLAATGASSLGSLGAVWVGRERHRGHGKR